MNTESEKGKEIVYNRIKKRLTIIELCVQLGILGVLVFSPAAVRISGFAEFTVSNPFLRFYIFAAIIGAVFYLAGLIFSFYGGYIIEKDFQVSNQTPKSWVLEQIKSLLLSLVIGIPLGGAFYATMLYGGSLWWFYFATVIVLLSVVLARLAPVLLFPIFYTFTPLQDDAIRERIFKHLKETKISIKNIFSFNLSKNTKKANAAFTGIGKSKRIILSDTLVENFSPEEIGSVFAHEVGHFRKKHIMSLMIISIVINYLSFFVCALFYQFYLDKTGYMYTHSLAAMPVLLLLLTLFSLITMPLTNGISRKFEWEADTYALDHEENDIYVSALEKLSELNIADRNPHPLYEWFFYSHPAIQKRIDYARSYGKKGGEA